MNNITACPLDCYDACVVEYTDKKLKGYKKGLTQGFLCPHLNHYADFKRIEEPRYKGETITMDEAIGHLKTILKQSKNILHYKGNGNFGLMQEVTDHFFTSYGATLTNGTLCDGAGEAGIIEGRGHNDIMTPSQIAKSEVVVFWGRNPHATSSHLLPLIKDKKVIVIDPVKTKAAEHADLHVQIKPHGDLQFAMLLSRFLCIEGSVDLSFVNRCASEHEDFYELTQTVRIKAVLDEIGATLGDIGKFLEIIKDKRVAIICGVGIQKYRDGADVIRAIDSFAALLGLFGKEGCGVSYLGSSRAGIESPFASAAKKVSKVDTRFGDFDTVFVQGTNPLNQMPDTARVKKEMQNVENLIYFGLFENQTSAMADLIIPAKNFLEKDDVRTYYGTHYLSLMPKQKESDIGISEYGLARVLCDEFGIVLKSEEEYLEHFKSFARQNEEGLLEVKGRSVISYEEGFTTDDEEFAFLEEIDIEFNMTDDFFLITSKSPTSLNSQFKTDNKVYINPSLGYIEGQTVEIVSKTGSVVLSVALDGRLRPDCVLIYSGTDGVNNLTTSKRSFEGNSAVFQENKVKIKII
ncbi:molybdopterin-dependent oxidoreductase [Sulfurimonas sp. HSL-1716]|uniref:molybdopterin-dependent oxidoreductase n=1 Tax=Hydrocurvibacter sulfurireducens TaxID=3131937 RepID=UPI0031F91F26